MKYLWLFFLCAGLTAQEAQVYEEFKVSIQQIHVNVTDKAGNPIKDLKPEDFEVKLNGKTQDVVSAYPISLSANVADHGAETDIPEQGRRLFLFMFDTQFTNKAGFMKAREDAMSFVLNEMEPKDLASVFTMNGGSIRVVCNFTSDKAQLSHALKTFGFGEAINLHKTTGYVMAGNLRDKDGVSAKEAFSTLSKQFIEDNEYLNLHVPGKYDSPVYYIRHGMKEAKEQGQKGQMIGYLDQFDTLAGYLSVIRGRKNMILFSGGFNNSTLAMGQETRGTDFVDGVRDSDNFAAGNVLSTVRRLVETLQGSGTVVFTVDTSKVKGDARQKTSLHILNDISSSTGGRVFTNSDDFDQALRDVKKITNDYYLVNIQSDLELPKGELAKVKVKVKRSGVRVYTSKALLLNPDFENLSPMERKLMLTDFVARDMTADAIPTNLDVFQLPWREDVVRLHLQLSVDGQYFLNGARHKPVTLDVTTALIDGNGNIMIDQNYRNFTIIPEKAEDILDESGLMYLGNLFARPGTYKLKTVVRNLMNGHTTSMIRDVTLTGEHPQIMGPYAVNQTPWVVMREEDLPVVGDDERKKLSYPFQFGANRFLPSANASLTSQKVNQLLYLYKGDEGAEVNPNIAAVVVDQEGQFKVAPPEAMKSMAYGNPESATTGIVLSLDTTPLQLQSGEPYTLLTRITMGDAAPIRSDYPFKAVEQLQ